MCAVRLGGVQAKAYTTRVGAGPYPTEIFGELGEEIRQIGAEYGTTTGRPRRVGWLDIPALKYATRCAADVASGHRQHAAGRCCNLCASMITVFCLLLYVCVVLHQSLPGPHQSYHRMRGLADCKLI